MSNECMSLPPLGGEVILQMGDCLDLMRNIPDGSVDMILCDLPYGKTNGSWDKPLPLKPLWEQYNRVVKENGAIVLFAAEPFASELRLSNVKNFKYDWVWDKVKSTGFLNANRQPLRGHEMICVFYKKQCLYVPQKTQGHKRKISLKEHKGGCKKSENYGSYGPVSYDSTERFPRSILTFSADTQKSSMHPTQKPVFLLEYLIRTYTQPGQTVLDNCMGSGSTGVACINSGRKFIGIELDECYYKTAVNRCAEAWNRRAGESNE